MNIFKDFKSEFKIISDKFILNSDLVADTDFTNESFQQK